MRFSYISIFISALFLLLGIFPGRSQEVTDEQRIENNLKEESLKEGDFAAKIVGEIEHFGINLISNIDEKTHEPHLAIEAPMPDKSTPLEPLTYNRDQKWWWNLLKEGKLSMTDTTVIWPKFLKFCVDVYNWGDRTFNSYDPEYVVGTGKRWKVRLVSDNWLDTYALRVPPVGSNSPIRTTMSSDVYANIGAYIQYMAVSIGSSYDIEKLFKRHEPSHKKYEFGFICALFNAELYYHENRGGVNIRKFGDVNDGKLIKTYFPGVSMYTLGFDAYYFFNNKRYSQGAAYNFAKYQLKSQGSFMLGISLTNQKLSFDFSLLPQEVKDKYPETNFTNLYFHYNSYAILAGYGYNWVLAPKLLFNATIMPSLGFSHYYEDSLEGDKYLISMNIQGRLSLTYNLGNYYFGLFGKVNGHYYKQGKMSLFSSIENFSAYVGLRF
ncbi:MAG: DUF4421 domain-containing protein [Muribaculaceae bacterium]|nr:DUF4421 domain-containing protein [Muribaculaceae bacterium]